MKKLIPLLLAWALVACTEKNPVLTVSGGSLVGEKLPGEKVYVYKGIPYAAPPVGELRWKAPQPVLPWEGVREALEFGHPAMQASHTPGGYTPEFFYEGDPAFSEDCLTLNIWTSRPGKPEAGLPVVLWLHGGGYVAGWSSEPEMDGAEWARRGVVMVSANYRLGLLGFLAHPALSAEDPNGVSGNYGMLDQVAALQWIRENIAQFGGDPDNVTIMGQSAGAASVQTLCVSPLSRGLFNKAIIQSGRSVAPENDNTAGADMETVLANDKAMIDWTGYETLEQMRAAPAEKMVSLANEYMRESGNRGPIGTAPVVDGYALPERFSTATYGGRIAQIPYMVGMVTGDNPRIRPGIRAFAAERANAGQPVYTYVFDRPLPTDGREGVLEGAFHSAELWYTFHTLDRCWRPFKEGDYALADRMIEAWTSFVKTGNPNGNGPEVWKPYSADAPDAMYFRVSADETQAVCGMEAL